MKKHWKRKNEKRYYETHRKKVLLREKKKRVAMKNGTYEAKPKFTKENVAKHTIVIE